MPDHTGAYQWLKPDTIVQVDLDDEKTQLILAGERDSFIRVAASNSTTAQIVGLDRKGFRIKNQAGAYVVVNAGCSPVTIDLTTRQTKRTLRRYAAWGRYVTTSSNSSVQIRGIQHENNGFVVGDDTAAASIVLTSNNTNVSDEDTVTIGSIVYNFETALTEAKASGTVTTSGTGAADNDTVTIGSVTYTFKTTLTGAANEVLRDGVEDHDLTNLKAAINAEAGAGTTYGTGTVANPDVTCGAVTSHAVTVTAKNIGTAGNSLALTKTGTVLTVSGSGTLSGGVNSVANEVVVSSVNADGSLTALAEAINAGANKGTDYSTATVANTSVSSSTVASHALTLTALNDQSGEDITTSTTATTLSFGNWAAGQWRVYRGITATINPSKEAVYTRLRRHNKSWIEI